MKFIFKNILLTSFIIHAYCMPKHYIRRHSNMQVLDAENFIKSFPSAKKIDCFNKIYFEYPSLPLHSTFGHTDFDFKGYLQEIFVLQVPQAKGVFDQGDFFWINNVFIKEIAAKNILPTHNYNKTLENGSLKKLNGSVVVLYHPCTHMYGHFVLDILGMLAVLEMKNIEYDYICLPYDKSFTKQLIELWDIPQHKILASKNRYGFIADSIILPTNVSRDQDNVKFVNYYHPAILEYIRNKILGKLQSLSIDTTNFCKKIFITRKDSYYRNIPNEDEIFKLFEQRGYHRYCLSDKSLTEIEQIALFNNATHIVGATGSNMTNVLFAAPGANILEFLQIWPDRTFYPVAALFGQNYQNLCDVTQHDLKFGTPDVMGRIFDIQKVEDFLQQHPEF